VTQAPANDHADYNSSDGESRTAHGGICAGGENATGEQRHRLDETEPEHLRAVGGRKALAKTFSVLSNDRGFCRALPMMTMRTETAIG
jgi:hypothetical protein